MESKERLFRYLFPHIPKPNAAAYAERCADESLKWGQRLSALMMLSCVLFGARAVAIDGSWPSLWKAVAGAAAAGAVFAIQHALRAGAAPPFGVGRPAAAQATAIALSIALAAHILAVWGSYGSTDRAGSLILAAIAANAVLMPTVQRPLSVAVVFAIDAAFVYASSTLHAEAGPELAQACVAAVAAVGVAAAVVMHRYRAQAFIQHEELAQKNELLEGAVRKLLDDNVHLESISTTDELTKLYNRRSFAARLDSYWAWSLRSKTSIGLILIDIDDFKLFNDSYGHLKGDLCLKAIADCLLASVSREMDFVARIGGEEFMIIVCSVSEDGVRFIAEKVRKNVENAGIEHKFSTVSKRVTVSMGCALVVPSHASTAVDLINQADIALYESKRTGKNRYTVYEQGTVPSLPGFEA